jgi:hypothetical protein
MATIALVVLGFTTLVIGLIELAFPGIGWTELDDQIKLGTFNVRYSVLMLLFSTIEILAALRSWSFRIPMLGLMATFGNALLLSDSALAPYISPFSLGAAGLLFYAGWVRPKYEPEPDEPN